MSFILNVNNAPSVLAAADSFAINDNIAFGPYNSEGDHVLHSYELSFLD
jgi:hypothetical protein